MTFRVQLVCEVDIGATIQQVSKIQAGPLQMNRIDLEVTPIQSAVRIVVIDLTFPRRIFGALNSQGYTAGISELAARVLLVGG